MPETPAGAPAFKAHREAYRELLKSLWNAFQLFKNEGDAGLEGAKLACRAAARFIAVRHENPELAAPFLALYQALEDVERGVVPDLFSVKSTIKERPRTALRKHVQMLAAVAAEVLMEIGDDLNNACKTVARQAGNWSQLAGTPITATTVRNWRGQCRRIGDRRNAQFNALRSHLLGQSDPRQAVLELLRDPTGLPKS